MSLSSADYGNLREIIYNTTGLQVDDNRLGDLERVVNTILTASRSTGLPNLLLTLMQSPIEHPLWQKIINQIAIGETYFFRNQDQFQALQQYVLPEIISHKRQSGYRVLRLWSAGCSTGEEPYSLAILLRELLPDIDEWAITVLGTDLNLNSLEHARQGCYGPRSFRQETRPDIQAKWFKPELKDYQLDVAIRKLVTFKTCNLVAAEFPAVEKNLANFDLIICRNVTIYFKEATTRKIVKGFYETLNQGGWLVIGHAEPLASTYQDFDIRNFENAVFYQKPTTSVIPLPPPAKAIPPAPPSAPPEPAPPAPNLEAILQAAQQAADREDWPSALKLLASVERQSQATMNPQVHYLRGLILTHMSDLDGAFQALRRAIYCDPGFALAHYTLGELYEKRGDYRNAERYWQMAQQALTRLDTADNLPFSSDLTVEMLQDLLNFKLKSLFTRKESR